MQPYCARRWNWDPASGGSNRFATVFLYLNDCPGEGHTVFPHGEPLPGANSSVPEGVLDLFEEGSWYVHPLQELEYL